MISVWRRGLFEKSSFKFVLFHLKICFASLLRFVDWFGTLWRFDLLFLCLIFKAHCAMCVWEMHIFIFLCISVQFMHSRLCAMCMWWRPIVAQSRRAKALSCAKGGRRRERDGKGLIFHPLMFFITIPSFLHGFSLDISNLEFAPKLSLYSHLAKLGSPTSSRKNHAATLPPSLPLPPSLLSPPHSTSMACPSPLLSAILGKALRVSHIRQDSEWLYLLFGGCNWFFWWVQLIWWPQRPVCNTTPPVPSLRCVWKRLLPSLRLSLSLQFLEKLQSESHPPKLRVTLSPLWSLQLIWSPPGRV